MTTTPPPESFRAAFDAGARWSSDTTTRPDAETALQSAWEAFREAPVTVEPRRRKRWILWQALALVVAVLALVGFGYDLYWAKEAFALGVTALFVVGVANVMTSALEARDEERERYLP